MQDRSYSVRFCFCRLGALSGDKIHSPLPGTGKGNIFVKEIVSSAFRQSCSCMLLSCLQLKNNPYVKVAYFVVAYYNPYKGMSYDSCIYYFNCQLWHGSADLFSAPTYPNLKTIDYYRLIQYAGK